jgi:guanylate kinase
MLSFPPHKTISLPCQLSQLADIASLERYSAPSFFSEAIHGMKASNLRYRFLVVSGPSGVGKSQGISHMRTYSVGGIEWKIVKRVTTRPRRPFDSHDEVSFVTDKQFTELEKRGELLYSEVYSGNSSRYGLLIDDMLRHIREGTPRTVLIVIGTLALCRILPDCAFVYLVPPSLDELRSRVMGSRKPGAAHLVSYAVLEMNGIAALPRSSFAHSHPVSILSNETNRQDECASSIGDVVSRGQQIIELPSDLISQLDLATR